MKLLMWGMKQISILGCGWLGFPLSKELIRNGYKINGSTTSPEKLEVLKNAHINPFLISLTAKFTPDEFLRFIDGSETLIINIPPKTGENENFHHSNTIENIIPLLERSYLQQIIYTSSISVYKDDNKVITENTIPDPLTFSGKQILKAEELLLNNPHFKTTVLRLGGLISEDRHPVKNLSGKTNLQKPEAVVNLIHRNDLIEIIRKLIENPEIEGIYNIVYPEHPERKIYYEAKAREKNLELPGFAKDDFRKGKIICSDKILKVISYQFKFRI